MQKKAVDTSGSEQGIVFPKNSREKRSSSKAVKQILSGSVQGIAPDLSSAIQNEKKWRKRYPGYINQINEQSIHCADNALAVAQEGLKAAYETMRFIRRNEEMTIDDAMNRFDKPLFHTGIINGSKPPGSSGSFDLPYKGRTLSGSSLLEQVELWEQQGIFEPSFGDAVRNVVEHGEWLNLCGMTFVLFGAGSEIAPFETLLNLGASVLAVDLENPNIWERLIRIARKSSGKLMIPLKQPFHPDMPDKELARAAGADLACDAPEIRTWLMQFHGPMTIGAYAYADGARHVRIALAMDAIIRDLLRHRNNVRIAFLLTPSDSFAVPNAVVEAAREKRKKKISGGLVFGIFRFFSFNHMFVPHSTTIVQSENGTSYGISDNIIVQQGPGYILAKNIQKWRCLIARSKGIQVSGNVAPATTTRSVFKNRLLAAGYAGLGYFKAEAFAGETTRALMTAALIYDINDPSSAANPKTPLGHPLELFMKTANHCGLWRITYKPASVLAFSVCLGFIKAVKRGFKPEKKTLAANESTRPREYECH